MSGALVATIALPAVFVALMVALDWATDQLDRWRNRPAPIAPGATTAELMDTAGRWHQPPLDWAERRRSYTANRRLVLALRAVAQQAAAWRWVAIEQADQLDRLRRQLRSTTAAEWAQEWEERPGWLELTA